MQHALKMLIIVHIVQQDFIYKTTLVDQLVQLAIMLKILIIHVCPVLIHVLLVGDLKLIIVLLAISINICKLIVLVLHIHVNKILLHLEYYKVT